MRLIRQCEFSAAVCLLLYKFMQNERAQVCLNSASHALRKLDQIEYENSAILGPFSSHHLPLPFYITSKDICTVNTVQNKVLT